MHNLTIIMYHYVRNLKASRYPEIKGLSTDLFKEQLEFIKKSYNPISAYDLIDAIKSNTPLPPKAILLTFDDGYIDHFNTVFPILDKEKISGCFFPPSGCILENKVLDVNKIHFCLASVEDKNRLVSRLYALLDHHRSSYNLKSNHEYWAAWGKPSRYDTAEVMFIKHMLQRVLPEQLRNELTTHLFEDFVSNDEASFAKELYMDVEQLSCLQRNNMYVGSHGHEHYWLEAISEEQQQVEVDKSLDFLKLIGSNTDEWIMCYPYGSYNGSLLNILKNSNCCAGLTTQVGIADLTVNDSLTLPRLDTNDLPKSAMAKPNRWHIEA